MFVPVISRISLAAISICALSACAAGPDYTPPSAAVLGVPERYAGAGTGPAAAATANWWTAFDDPLLVELIETSLARNDDVAAAQARLRAARAALRGAGGALLPSLDASAGASARETLAGPRFGDGDGDSVGLDASWEADIFGGNRRSLEAARAEARGADARLDDVRRAIAAEVALNHVEARNVQARLRIARSNLRLQDETVEIAGWRNRAGLVGSLDIEQAKAQRAQTAAGIPQLEQALAAALNRLGVLTGGAPDAIAGRYATVRPVPVPPDAIDAGVPAELLRQRPDVVAAEATLAAEVARIGVSESRLYPALRLSGSIGSSAASPAGLGESIIANLAAGIGAPLFNGGQLRAQVDRQRAAADAALATYRGTVMRAAEEVENALVARDKARASEEQFALAEEAAANAALLAEAQYRSGLIDFRALLDTQRTLLSAQDSRAAARAARATAAIQLYKALGGGWSPTRSPETGS